MSTQTSQSTNQANSKPTHTLRKKIGYGKQASFENIGAAWDRGDGSFYIKLYGAQVIDSGFYAFPRQDQSDQSQAPSQQAVN